MIGSEENYSWWEEQEETSVSITCQKTHLQAAHLKLTPRYSTEGAYKQPEFFPIASPRAAEAVSDLFWAKLPTASSI